MKRTEERELAFKYIYSKFFLMDQDYEIENVSIQSLEFVKLVLTHFAKNYEVINKKISANLKGYTLERLNKIDLAIITLAIIELDYIKENPKQVVINEAVELAKKYSTENSPKFVNGFLANLYN